MPEQDGPIPLEHLAGCKVVLRHANSRGSVEFGRMESFVIAADSNLSVSSVQWLLRSY